MFKRRTAGTAAVAFILLAGLAGLASAALPPRTEIQTDSRTGLAWLRDSSSAVRAGVVSDLLVPKGQAAARLKAFNAHAAAKFGTADWRLAKAAEIRGRLASASPAEAARLRALLARSRASGGKRVAFVVVRAEAISAGFAGTVLFATNSIHVKNDGAIASGDVVANQASAGPWLATGAELTFGPSATAAAGSNLKGDSVRVKSGSVVGGAVFANDAQNQGTVAGGILTPLSLPVLPLLPAFHSGAPGTINVSVPAGQSQVLAAGDYAALVLGNDAVAYFTGGTYRFSSIATGSRAQLLFDAAAEVQVAGRLALGTDGILAPRAGATIGGADIVFYVAGINGTTGALSDTPLAADIGVRGRVVANLYVPNGTLNFKQGSWGTGAFLARDLAAGPRASFSLASAFVNHPPIARDDAATVEQGGSVSLLDSSAASLLANDSDPDGDPLTVTTTAVSGPQYGTLTLAADGTFHYTHLGGHQGSDSFVYEACDAGFPILCDTATVTIVIENQPPNAVDDSATVARGGSVSLLDSGDDSVLANDTDPGGDALTVTMTPVSGPQYGTLTLAADGTFLYTHLGGLEETDSFVYEACDDGSPILCDTATVTIAIQTGSTRVTVHKAGNGSGRVTSSPAAIDCGLICSKLFAPETILELLVEPAVGSVFAGFSGPGCGTIFVVGPDDRECTATFEVPAPVTLNVRRGGAGGGRVTSIPEGIDCGSTCSADFTRNSRVDLVPQADPDSVFAGWEGEGCEDGNVTMSQARTCTAVFHLLPTDIKTLTVRIVGTGAGFVRSDPAGIGCAGECSASFVTNTTVQLLASADRDSEPPSTFVSWGGDCGGTTPATTVTLDVDKTCTATIDLLVP